MEDQIKNITLTESTPCHLSYELIKKINDTVVAHNNLFQIGAKEREIQPLIKLYNGTWWVNRYVGEVLLRFEESTHKIVIKPRFGEIYLFKLLETIFNFQFVHSRHSLSNARKQDNYLKQIIGKIWLSQLGQANKYGLPRKSIQSGYYGPQIKGKLSVRDSLKILHSKQQLKSNYYKKALDYETASILYRAYNILNQDYGLPNLVRLPKSVQVIIHELDSEASLLNKNVEKFNTKKLSSVYSSFKSVLELSLDIIKKRNKENKTTQNTSEGYSFLLDMAEVWELYLLNLFKNRFSSRGWNVSSPMVKAYADKFYRTTLIPDIVLVRKEQVLVFDAKYKFMRREKYDLDRTDFFQIHTYMSYFEKRHQVKIAGLIYPFSKSTQPLEKIAVSMINDTSRFIVDGLDFSKMDNYSGEKAKGAEFLRVEKAFLNDLEKHLIASLTDEGTKKNRII